MKAYMCLILVLATVTCGGMLCYNLKDIDLNATYRRAKFVRDDTYVYLDEGKAVTVAVSTNVRLTPEDGFTATLIIRDDGVYRLETRDITFSLLAFLLCAGLTYAWVRFNRNEPWLF